MAYEPLHHKYRPQTFGDLVGQETIALTLSNALKQERIAPAYLFTGPRGTGKTSSARILAKSLNCLNSSKPTPYPCGKCEACLAIANGAALDVMEIDAASNTGVDNIREIIERSRFAPVQCRYKIYAIDECHMLSTAAFNALLKTLEEPPPQVVFILATTDPQRVLSTIISRCQRFDYRRIPLEEMTAHLKYIADAEKIAIADEALTLIAQIANGGLRDAESLLDQLSLLPETITVAKVWDLVGAVPEQDLLLLLRAINHNDSLAVLQQCRSLLDRGREPLVVLQNLASFYLNLLIAKTSPQHSDLTAVTKTCWQQLCTEAAEWQTASILRGQQHLKEAETQLKRTTQPRLWLEVTLLGLLPEVYQAISVTEPALSTQPAVPTPSSANPGSAATTNNYPTATNPSQSAAQKVNSSKVHPAPAPVSRISAPPEASVKSSPPTSLPRQNSENLPTVAASTAPVAKRATSTSKIAPNPHQDPIANQEIWSKVVSCLQPPTTQALLKQQCHLVSFDGLSAVVGISSAKLQKLNQKKVPNIEAAFAQVCQRMIKVQLEVANPQDSSAGSTAASTAQSIVEEPKPVQEQFPPQALPNNLKTVPREPESIQPQPQSAFSSKQTAPQVVPSRAVSPSHDNQSSTVTLSQDLSVLTAPTIPSENALESPTAALDPSQSYADNNLQQAIDNLTQSFEGELVQLDNKMQEELLTETELSEPAIDFGNSERPDVNDYDDDW